VLGVAINGMKADVSADYADYRYGYEYQYSYGDTKDTVQKNKIQEFLEKIFINQQEGLHLTIVDRIRKWRVAAALAAIIAFIGGSCVITSSVKSCVSDKQQHKVVKSHSLIDTTHEMKPEAIVSDITPEIEVPQELVEQASSIQDSIKALPQEMLPEAIIPQSIPNNNQPAKPVIQQSIPIRPTVSKPLPVEESSPIQHLIPSTPYSIRIASTGSLKNAKNYTSSYIQQGLNDVFVTVEFTGPTSKRYIVCYGNYANESAAEQKSMELQFLGFEGDFTIVNLPYSILIGEYRSAEQAKSSRTSHPDISEFINIKKSGTKTFALVGAFASEEIADLFLQQNISLQDKQIVMR